jgi:nitrite reductase/ring-hydroxylating ferredoxin subunit
LGVADGSPFGSEVPMAGFVEVGKVADLAEGTVTVVDVSGHRVALVNVEGSFFAVDNECPHRGAFLGEGEINPDWNQWALECPLHGSVFDVRSGEVLNPPAATGVRAYPVEVDGVAVRISAD